MSDAWAYEAGPITLEPVNQLAVVKVANGDRWFRDGVMWRPLAPQAADRRAPWSELAAQAPILISAGVQS